ncbi:tyrosine-type recombinase/integrase [Bordetella genomosp. 4]|uniref:tyrosine-type recombinase/integrase n=1 Tax=Bordetella genomosp. 4 TaxID=463044 RepID=UPI000B9EBCED|nr:integrase arm-type DNA-binding domain-containing protein [Bordetella genomosp. 4]OZI43178.1 integrase [Bordetella genomosp. 4]
MPLTDTACRQAKPASKPYKLADGGGLYLLISPTGKYWRWDYRYVGKRKTLALGVYPESTLALARERHQAARKFLADGIDPGEKKKSDKRAARVAASNSFEAVARAWMKERQETVAPAQHIKTQARMESDVFPWLGRRSIIEIEAPDILDVLERVDQRGARFTAHRLRSEISRVFRFGIKKGYCKHDPARDLIGAIPPAVETHFASITEPAKVGEMLRAFEGFSGTFAVQCALKLAPLVFVRPGELRTAEWEHINLDKAEWRYRVSKTGTDHLVPLASQAVSILRELHSLTGNGRYVFPGARSHERPMSGAAINAALRRLGYDTRTEITGHGFRAMARTILHEELGQKPEVIEHQLAHAVPDMLGAAYNRTKFIKERRNMMQTWADYLDLLNSGPCKQP